MRYVKVTGLAAMLLVSMLFLTGALCQSGPGTQPTPTLVPTATIAPTATPPAVEPTPSVTANATLAPTSTPPAAEPTPSATPDSTTEATPTTVATLSAGDCVTDRDAIQAAVDAYHRDHGEWPTADGRPGAIIWSKLVNDYLPYHPYTRVHCYWQVNSYPEGEVCVPPEYMC